MQSKLDEVNTQPISLKYMLDASFMTVCLVDYNMHYNVIVISMV